MAVILFEFLEGLGQACIDESVVVIYLVSNQIATGASQLVVAHMVILLIIARDCLVDDAAVTSILVDLATRLCDAHSGTSPSQSSIRGSDTRGFISFGLSSHTTLGTVIDSFGGFV